MLSLPRLSANVPGVCATHLEHALTECQADARGKEQIVFLKAGKRVAKESIAVGNLPAEPVFQLRGGGGIELEAEAARVRNVWVQAELLGDGGAVVDLGVEGFTEVHLASLARNGGRRGSGCGSGDGAKEILIKVAAGKHVECGGLGVDDVIAEAAADNVAQIEVLELVVLKIGEAEDEKLVADVQIPTDAAADSMGGGGINVVDSAVGVDR